CWAVRAIRASRASISASVRSAHSGIRGPRLVPTCSAMIDSARLTHSLQMYTPGPATTLSTSECGLEQNEQRIGSVSAVWVMMRLLRKVCVRDCLTRLTGPRLACQESPDKADGASAVYPLDRRPGRW